MSAGSITSIPSFEDSKSVRYLISDSFNFSSVTLQSVMSNVDEIIRCGFLSVPKIINPEIFKPQRPWT